MKILKLPKICNIDISFDITTLILLILIANSCLSIWQQRIASLFNNYVNFSSIIISVCFSVFVIFSILFHELGHAIVGRKYGVKIEEITIFVLGGMAKATGRFLSPKSEAATAIAGPIVSMLFGLLCCVLFLLIRLINIDHNISLILSWFIIDLDIINIILSIFNLIPAFPLDGGRLVRSLIWKISHNYITATTISSFIGRLFAFGLIGCGVLRVIFGINVPIFGESIVSGIWSCIIGFMLNIMAKNELQMAKNSSI